MTDQQQHDPLKEIEGLTDLPAAIDVDLTPKGADGKPVASETVQRERRAAGEPPKDDENTVALKRQLAEERRRREEVEARNREIEAQRQRAEEQSAEGQLRLITNSLAGATADKVRAREDLRSAMANGEHDKAVDAQEALNDAQIRMDRLNAGKQEFERRAEQEKVDRERQRNQPTRPVRSSDDPVEELAKGLSTKSAAWVRANPDCVTDPRRNRQMVRAHEDALDDGLNVDTPEYFAFIEKKLGIGHDDGASAGQAKPTARRAPAAVDAPVSRGGNGDGRGSRANTVTLNPAQRQFCDESGIKYEDYARNLLALKAEGRMQ